VKRLGRINENERDYGPVNVNILYGKREDVLLAMPRFTHSHFYTLSRYLIQFNKTQLNYLTPSLNIVQET
jgi:hypothetical protein